ncbi:uncharacterized protein VP01_4430g4, partial [Puccinia sorghi]
DLPAPVVPFVPAVTFGTSPLTKMTCSEGLDDQIEAENLRPLEIMIVQQLSSAFEPQTPRTSTKVGQQTSFRKTFIKRLSLFCTFAAIQAATSPRFDKFQSTVSPATQTSDALIEKNLQAIDEVNTSDRKASSASPTRYTSPARHNQADDSVLQHSDPVAVPSSKILTKVSDKNPLLIMDLVVANSTVEAEPDPAASVGVEPDLAINGKADPLADAKHEPNGDGVQNPLKVGEPTGCSSQPGSITRSKHKRNIPAKGPTVTARPPEIVAKEHEELDREADHHQALESLHQHDKDGTESKPAVVGARTS